MKTTYRNVFAGGALLIGAVAFTACDDVAEGDRYILADSVVAERAVLLEDFTGQGCLNCPEAHEVIEQLEEQYGSDKVIAVSIHSGTFGKPVQFTNFAAGSVGLMTAEGQAIMQSYGIQSFPMGVIDMGTPMTHDLWPTAVRNALKVPTDVSIELATNYVADERDGEDDGYYGTIEAKARIMSGSTRNVDVQFWIVENGIVAEQKNGSVTIPDYIHNNVFRAQIFDGLRGQSQSLTAGFESIVEGSIMTRWTNTEHWELENLSVVAFVSDKSGVLQVTKVPLFPNEDPDDSETEAE